MKLVAFLDEGIEKWGFVLEDREGVYAERIIVSVRELLEIIPHIRRYTTYFELTAPPISFEKDDFPKDITAFLKTGENGMRQLRGVVTFVEEYSKHGDRYVLDKCLYKESDVKILPPIMRPRVYWGLVQNCPAFFRNDPNRDYANLYPQGHQRTHASAIGHKGIMEVRGGDAAFPVAITLELGVIIGKPGKYIPAEKAMEYVAGYTCVVDAVSRLMKNSFDESVHGKDWYIDATTSWVGKKTDTFGAMGPYLVTKDEIVNPYGLLGYTKQNGLLRDVCFSGELIIGIERAIAYYSNFARLEPGDVIHMGAMQVDGIEMSPNDEYGKEENIEVCIEGVGELEFQVVCPEKNDWRSPSDPSRRIHPSPMVQKLFVEEKNELVLPSDFDADEVCHFWTAFKNNEKAVLEDGYLRFDEIPRMLNNPGRAVSSNGEVFLSRKATRLKIGIELSAVIKKVARDIKPEEAHEYILGYTPMISIHDLSMRDDIIEPRATKQEIHITLLYARQGDGYNIVMDEPVPIAFNDIKNAKTFIEIKGIGTIESDVSEYIIDAETMLCRLSEHCTLFPGDVITLGEMSTLIDITSEQAKNGIQGKGRIEKLGEINFRIKKEEEHIEQ